MTILHLTLKVVSNQTNHTCHITSTHTRDYFFTYVVFSLIEPCWFFIRGGDWCKPPRKVSYKRTFGAPDQGQMLDVWESQTTESALRWRMRHIVPHHTLEVVLEVILGHVLGIKTTTSLILDHVAIAYLYLGNNIGEKVLILFIVIILELSQDWSWSIKHAPQSFLLYILLKSHNFHFGITTITPSTTLVILVALTRHTHLTSRVSLRLAKRLSASNTSASHCEV
jgi:hypothetical protein